MPILAKFREARAHPRNPDAFWINGVSGAETAAGVNVDEDVALTATAIWNGVRVLSEANASMPLNVMEVSGRSRVVASEHPAHRVLNAPNDELTSFEFREMMQANVLLAGDAFAEIVFDGSGRPVQLWPIWPHRIQPVRLRDDGPLVYEVATPSGQKVVLPMERVLHIRGFSRGGLCGLNVVEAMRQSVGLTLALEQYGASFYGNGSQPGGVLKHPGKLSAEAKKKLKDAWERAQQGLGRAHRTALLEEGMEWQQMGIAPEQAQAIESRKFQVTEAARILNMPPHMLKDMERATFSNIEHQFIEFASITFRPWCVRFEQRYDKSLLLPSERGSYYAHYKIEGLLRGDIKTRYESYAVARNWSWLSANDIRELEDLNPIDEPWADDYLAPLNMVPASQSGIASDPAPAGRSDVIRDRVARAHLPPFLAVAERLLGGNGGGELGAVRAAARKHPEEADFRAWLDTFVEQQAAFAARAFEPAVASLVASVYAALDPAGDPPPAVMARLAADIGVRWASECKDGVLGCLRSEDPHAALDTMLTEWAHERAKSFSHNEIPRAAATATEAINGA